MKIRCCRESDLAALEWDGEFAHDRHIIHSTFARTREGTTLMLVAEDRSAHLGQAWIDLRGVPGIGRIWALRVKPSCRGRGIGARLLRASEEVIASRGLRVAELEVQPQNVPARRLYEKLGYTHVRSDLALDERGHILGVSFDVLQKSVCGAGPAARV